MTLAAGSREPWLAVEQETANHGSARRHRRKSAPCCRATVTQLCERFASWALELPRIDHPELGSI